MGPGSESSGCLGQFPPHRHCTYLRQLLQGSLVAPSLTHVPQEQPLCPGSLTWTPLGLPRHCCVRPVTPSSEGWGAPTEVTGPEDGGVRAGPGAPQHPLTGLLFSCEEARPDGPSHDQDHPSKEPGEARLPSQLSRQGSCVCLRGQTGSSQAPPPWLRDRVYECAVPRV